MPARPFFFAYAVFRGRYSFPAELILKRKYLRNW